MNKVAGEPLSDMFTCTPETQAGDIVEIIGDMSVQPISSQGSANVVGEVISRHSASNYGCLDPETCVVVSSFVLRRTRVSGAAVPVGPFCFGAGNAVFPVADGQVKHGMAITHATDVGQPVETLEF